MRCLIPIAIVTHCAAAILCGADLAGVLASMDKAAASFTGVHARIEKETFTAVINDRGVERGEMWMSRPGGKSSNTRMRIEFTEPDRRSFAIAGSKAQLYYPKVNTVNEYDLGKQRDLVEQFLLLGFGTSGKNLVKDYQTKVTGSDKIGGAQATRLELVPKDKQAREHLLRAELWIADDGGYPVKEKLYWPSDDTTTIVYSDVQINPPLSDSDVSLHAPADAKHEFPGR